MFRRSKNVIADAIVARCGESARRQPMPRRGSPTFSDDWRGFGPHDAAHAGVAPPGAPARRDRPRSAFSVLATIQNADVGASDWSRPTREADVGDPVGRRPTKNAEVGAIGWSATIQKADVGLSSWSATKKFPIVGLSSWSGPPRAPASAVRIGLEQLNGRCPGSSMVRRCREASRGCTADQVAGISHLSRPHMGPTADLGPGSDAAVRRILERRCGELSVRRRRQRLGPSHGNGSATSADYFAGHALPSSSKVGAHVGAEPVGRA